MPDPTPTAPSFSSLLCPLPGSMASMSSLARSHSRKKNGRRKKKTRSLLCLRERNVSFVFFFFSSGEILVLDAHLSESVLGVRNVVMKITYMCIHPSPFHAEGYMDMYVNRKRAKKRGDECAGESVRMQREKKTSYAFTTHKTRCDGVCTHVHTRTHTVGVFLLFLFAREACVSHATEVIGLSMCV